MRSPSIRIIALLSILSFAVTPKAETQGGVSLAPLRAAAEIQQLAPRMRALTDAGRYSDAIQIATHIVELTITTFGPEDPVAGAFIAVLANLYRLSGDYEQAKPLFEKSIRIIEKRQGPGSPDLAPPLNGLGMLLTEEAKFSSAQGVLTRALDIQEKVSQDLLLAQILNNLGYLHYRTGNDSLAAPLFQRAVAILQNDPQPAAQATLGTSLNNQGLVMMHQGRYSPAESVMRHALEVRKKVLGPEHIDVAQNLSSIGELFRATGYYEKAKGFYNQALAIHKLRLGERHPSSAALANNMGLLYLQQGNYAQARQYLGQALDVRRATLPKEHPDLIVSLINLGWLASVEGDYTYSAKLLEEAAAAIEINPNAYPTIYVTCLNKQGWLYLEQGDLPRARLLFEKALEHAGKNPASGYWETGETLNNLARISFLQNDYHTARSLIDRSLPNIERILGRDHPEYATLLNNMGVLLTDMKDYRRAETLLEQALEIRRTVFGAEHPSIATSLGALGDLYSSDGNMALAMTFLREALQVREMVLSPNHPDIATSLNNLASAYLYEGDYPKAKLLFAKELRIRAATIGESHPLYADALGNIALAQWGEGNIQQARDTFLKVIPIQQAYSQRLLPSLSFAEQREYLDRQWYITGILLSTFRNQELFRKVYSLIFSTKGFLIQSLRLQTSISRLGIQPQYKKAVEKLRLVRSGLADSSNSAVDVAVAERRRRIDHLTSEKEALERQLARALPAGMEDHLLDLPAFQALLQSDEIFIDLYRYNFLDLTPQSRKAEVRYGAALVGSGQPVEFVDLGAAGDCDQAVATWRAEILRGADAQAAWRVLETILWKPVAARIPQGIRKVWLSPDGELARVPWHLLVEQEGETAGMLLSQIDSARELAGLRSTNHSAVLTPVALLAGGIDFNAGLPASSNRNAPFDRLPGAAVEIQSLQQIGRNQNLRMMVFTGTKATKEAIQQNLPQVTYAHLATHGFFSREHGSNSVRSAQLVPVLKIEGPSLAHFRNPLVESGIALAGANYQGPAGSTLNGLLTAEELVGIDLRRLQLVTLSACETGRGEEVTGQGVLGLRAAILAAGARSMLMSLWKVPDEATSKVMRAFYSHLWARKLPKIEALRRAQVEVRDDPSGRFSDPIHWAAWVLVGEAW